MIAFCGRADEGIAGAGCFDRVLELRSTGLPLDELIENADPLLTRLAEGFANGMPNQFSQNPP